MLCRSSSYGVLPAIFLFALTRGVASASSRAVRRGSQPLYYFDPGTTSYCSWWVDNDGTLDCSSVPDEWFITLEDFLRWNPSITPECGNFAPSQSYCVEAINEPPPGGPTTTPAPTTTQPPTSTPTTTSGNGIQTPLPTQPGMVNNCDAFYFVKEGDGCATIAAAHGISLADFTTWNPGVGATCSTMWANAYVCVSIIGHTPSPTTTPLPPTTTSSGPTTTSGNGVATPTPTQPGMTPNCRLFHLVKEGEGCYDIAAAAGISLSDFLKWNPGAGSDCSTLWKDSYACIGVL